MAAMSAGILLPLRCSSQAPPGDVVTASLKRSLLCPLGVLVLVLSGVAGPAWAYKPEDVVTTAARLSALRVDTAISFAADGQVLDRPGLQATFATGRFHPIQREDGRICGLVFEGKGMIRLSIPEGVETTAWQMATDFAPWEQEISAAYLRFTDASLDELQGDRALEPIAARGGGVFRAWTSRSELLINPDWTRWQTGLIIDQLMDLYGGGHVGGHLLAEFRMVQSSPGGWLSYLHNPRGALLGAETTTLYKVRRRGAQVPPEINILSSFGSSPEAADSFDVMATHIDITFPTRSRNDRNLVNARAVAEVDLVALRRDKPLRAVVLELESQRPLCTAQSYETEIKISRVVDSAGRSLAAIHRGSKVLIPLHTALQAGQPERLTIEYGGAMTQGLPGKKADTFFSEIGPWAWYPRNPRSDRFASRVAVHLPRFMRAVAPGSPVETREEKTGWHYVYEEPGGVRNLTLVVGDLVRSKPSEGGVNPKVITWYPSTEQKRIGGTADAARTMLDFVASVWGPYPYSTLHVVENLAYPPNNWAAGETGSGGSWSCVPPGNLHAWQGIVEGPSGMVLSVSPTTAPAVDIEEARAYERLLIDPMESAKYLRVIDLARQWWGHMVPAKTYRDTWIGEAMATWTGLVFIQAAVGRPALKERLDTLHDLMVDGSNSSPPLATGQRLGRSFPFQVWGRGPLIVNSLVKRLTAQVFLNAARTLINRTAGPGVATDTFVESLSSGAGDELQELVRRAVESTILPQLDYNFKIDKASGRIDLVIRHRGDEVIPVDVWVEAAAGLKKREWRRVLVNKREVVLQWQPAFRAKQLKVDPLKTSLTAAIRRDRKLSVADSATP
jgi:hypothetical protein